MTGLTFAAVLVCIALGSFSWGFVVAAITSAYPQQRRDKVMNIVFGILGLLFWAAGFIITAVNT